MRSVPKGNSEKIGFYESHLSPFSSNAVAIGTSVAAVADLTTKTEAAREALSAQLAAKDAAEAATTNLRVSVSAMAAAGASILDQIRGKARLSGDGIYGLAQLSPPAPPTPIGPLGTATDFVVQLQQDGTLILKWKCKNPVGATGTTYQVSRKLGATGEFILIGGSGKRQYVDATVPAGTTQVTYRILATRSNTNGAPAQFTVTFGVSGGGQVTASLIESPRIAA